MKNRSKMFDETKSLYRNKVSLKKKNLLMIEKIPNFQNHEVTILIGVGFNVIS
jgi:hypothetical protein